MRADNSRHLIEAARHRTQQTRDRATAALRRMDATGQRINFDTVARQAGVSRSWLYTQDDLRTEIERLRARYRSAAAARPVPDRQRASDSSLLRRLEAATTRIRALEADNQQLRDALARALGERRAVEVTGQARPPRHAEENLAENYRRQSGSRPDTASMTLSASHQRRSQA